MRYIMNRDRQNSIESFAFVISTAVTVGLCCGFVSNLGADELASSRHEIELECRINPNDAPVESLVRLPGLGTGRAGAIVAYRTDFNRTSGTSRAFQHCDDLRKISGIGPKTVQEMSEWIKFE